MKEKSSSLTPATTSKEILLANQYTYVQRLALKQERRPSFLNPENNDH
jgi:hypothetical protein